jgi:hypothetical protein
VKYFALTSVIRFDPDVFSADFFIVVLICDSMYQSFGMVNTKPVPFFKKLNTRHLQSDKRYTAALFRYFPKIYGCNQLLVFTGDSTVSFGAFVIQVG